MSATPNDPRDTAERDLLRMIRALGIDAGDMLDVINRARHRPRLAFEYWVRWCTNPDPRWAGRPGLYADLERKADERWTAVARRLAADLIAAACPPVPADEPPSTLPLAWQPEVDR